MEMFVVFGLGAVVSRLLRASSQSTTKKSSLVIVIAIIVAYFAVKVIEIQEGTSHSAHSNSLYDLAGMNRSIPSEDFKKYFRALARDKHPDRNPQYEDAESEFIAFKKAFDILENHTDRNRYELYGGWAEDSGRKSLFALLPFYVIGVVMTYCLTCEKETIIAGRAACLWVVALGCAEWRGKMGDAQVLGYKWMPFTVYEQFEALRTLTYPMVLVLYAISCHLHSRKQALRLLHQTQYPSHRITTNIQRNTASLQALKSHNLTDRDLDLAIEQNSIVGRVATEELAKVGQKKDHWRAYVSLALFLGITWLTQRKSGEPEESS